ncbi:MAG: hypothetical protein HY321_18130 [Armatimonadetes bacterium]|nr:hypothetical protein [Armatimonadota bacterium]
MQIRNPAFFEAPSFWKSDWGEVNAYLDGVKAGQVWEIGRSHGGLPIRAVAYGPKEPIERRGNPFSAEAFGHPEDFFDPRKRTRPVVVLISTVHGVEIEGCVACLNFAHLMESGADLRGRRWEALHELAAGMRVVLVPLAQPDGRVRSAVRHLRGGSLADLSYYGQGVPKPDAGGDLPEGWHYRYSPVPVDRMEYQGGYTNDGGINIDLDDFFSAHMAPETRALMDLVRDETPDGFLVMHSHNPGPWIASPNALVPERCQYHQVQLGALVAARHRRDDLRPAWRAKAGLDRSGYFGTINLPTALHHVSGALPLAFEFPHGLAPNPYTFDEILDIGLTLFEEILRYIQTWGRQRGR